MQIADRLVGLDEHMQPRFVDIVFEAAPRRPCPRRLSTPRAPG